jgi:nucleotide-binding universal stress UspA family protein
MALFNNHILFPTDFSNNAKRALPFAAAIAQRTQAKLTLFHASQDTMDFAPSFETTKEETIDQADKYFNELISELREEEKFNDLNISTILQSGQPTTSLLNTIAEHKTDLVVMGTKGATGDRNVLMGSVTTNIIKKSAVPVLAIPEGCKFDNFENILFTTDYKEGDWGALKQTAELAELFESNIDVLHVSQQQNLESEIRFRGFRDLVQSNISYKNIDFHHQYEADFFPGAADYLIEHSSSLLVMIRYKKSFWEKLAERNHSEEMALYSNVPLLVLIGDDNRTADINSAIKEKSK